VNRARFHVYIFSGGTLVTVHGSNLNSVAEPRITLTVITTRFYNDSDSAAQVGDGRISFGKFVHCCILGGNYFYVFAISSKIIDIYFRRK